MSKVLVALDKDISGDNRVLRQISMLQNTGHDVLVVCYNRKKDPFTFRTHEVNISRKLANVLLPLENRFGTLSRFWTRILKKVIVDFQPDFLIGHDLYMAKPCKNALTRTGSLAKLVVDLHENFPVAINTYGWTQNWLKRLVIAPELWKKKEKEYLFYADYIIALSESFKQELTDSYIKLQDLPFIIFPNFPDLSKLTKQDSQISIELKFDNDTPVLFYFGVVGKRRGIFDSLTALKTLHSKGIRMNFLIAGPIDKSDRAEFKTWLDDPLITPYLSYIPWINFVDLSSYFNRIDINIAPFKVNPQHESGVANKIYQYMYSGKPLVVSNCKPQAEIVERFNCGRVYKEQEELVIHLMELAKNKELRKKMGESGEIGLKELMKNSDSKNQFLSIFK